MLVQLHQYFIIACEHYAQSSGFCVNRHFFYSLNLQHRYVSHALDPSEGIYSLVL